MSHAPKAQGRSHLLFSATLTLALPLTGLISTAQAQVNGAAIAEVGNHLPAGGFVTGFTHLRVNDAGSWGAVVLSDHAIRTKRIFRDGTEVLAVGDSLGSHGAPADVADIVDFDLSDNGLTTSLLELDNGVRALFYDAALVLAEGFPASLPGFSTNAEYLRLQKVNANGTDQVLLRCLIRDTGASPPISSCLVEVTMAPGGGIASAVALARTGDVPPMQSSFLTTFGTGDNQLTFSDSGSGTWSGELQSGATPGVHVAYAGSGDLIYQGGRNAPFPGRTYADVPLLASAFTESGSWATSALMDPSNTSNDEIIVVDGSIYARENGNLLAFPGAPSIESIGRRNLFLTPALEPIFYVDVAGDPTEDEGIVRGGEVVVREGQRLVTGETVTGLSDAPFAFHASDSGHYVLALAQLDGSTPALLYLQRDFGEPYCAAENNSTGSPSVTVATGTSLVAVETIILTTTGLPEGAACYYLSSLDSANVLFPGGSAGRLCLGGSVGRHVDGVGIIGADGRFSYSVDLTAIPTSPNVAVLAGDTWHHQLWHRDVGSSSNFSLPVRVTYH